MNTPFIIPLYQPHLHGNERRYVNECLDSTWISSKGEFIARFENIFQSYVGIDHAAGVCNGTVAVHLALLALGIGPGDEVIVPSLTYIASVNPIVYVGALPVFVDSRQDSWQLDSEDVARKITSKTKAILAVHLYGQLADMEAIMALADRHRLFVIEDCAEAIGTRLNGRHVGTFGDIAAFSFFGNKTITTGEGGMVVTRDAGLHERVLRLKGQGLAKYRVYWHDMVGYNYRMTNICAALGVAQMEQIDIILSKKRKLASWYDHYLSGLPVQPHRPVCINADHSYWMYSVLLAHERRDEVMEGLAACGIETRPLFYPVHTMPMYAGRYQRLPVAEDLARRGINLPSWPDLTEDQVRQVVDCLATILKKMAD